MSDIDRQSAALLKLKAVVSGSHVLAQNLDVAEFLRRAEEFVSTCEDEIKWSLLEDLIPWTSRQSDSTFSAFGAALNAVLRWDPRSDDFADTVLFFNEQLVLCAEPPTELDRIWGSEPGELPSGVWLLHLSCTAPSAANVLARLKRAWAQSQQDDAAILLRANERSPFARALSERYPGVDPVGRWVSDVVARAETWTWWSSKVTGNDGFEIVVASRVQHPDTSTLEWLLHFLGADVSRS